MLNQILHKWMQTACGFCFSHIVAGYANRNEFQRVFSSRTCIQYYSEKGLAFAETV